MSAVDYITKMRFQSPEAKATFYVGNEAQINAGLGVLCQLLSDQKRELPPLDYKLLLFGQTGSGKSSFPEGLAKSFLLNNDLEKLIRSEKIRCSRINDEFTLFHIRCNLMMSSFDDEVSLKRFLGRLETEIEGNKPAVVAFDELDAFSPERMKMIALSPTVFYWTMSFMQRSKRGLVIFGILNHPGILEGAVISQIDNLFYFEELDQKIVEAVLRNRDIPYASELALRICTSTEIIVLGNELRNACDKLIQTLGQGSSKNLAGFSYEEIAKAIMPWLKTSWVRRKEYEEANADYITKARQAIDFWKNRYDFFMKQGL